jgi:hypothetical protein
MRCRAWEALRVWLGTYMAVSARSMGSGRVLKSFTDRPCSKFTIASSFTSINPVMSLLHMANFALEKEFQEDTSGGEWPQIFLMAPTSIASRAG